MAGSQGEKKYDLVVFGATGFTGQYVVEEVARSITEERRVSWAVAGRNMHKLQQVVKSASDHTGTAQYYGRVVTSTRPGYSHCAGRSLFI